jgi:fructokinase
MRIGIDLGGSKIEIIALDDRGAQRHRTRIPTPAHDYGAILGAICELVEQAERAIDAHASVGIGTPGALSPATGLLRNSNTQSLNGKPLDRDLARVLGRPVRIANDANCFALSEATDGAARGADVVFGVIVGTGTGGGVVVRGHVLAGLHAIAGEWGHNPLPWPADDERPGPPCYCGKRGCIETFLSGPGLARAHDPAARALCAREIAQRAAAGDPAAQATLARYADRMARSLASVINVVDPDVVVLGGGLSRIEALYQQVPALLPRYVFSDSVRTRLCAAAHGDSSGVRGAAWLWQEAG